MTPAEEWSLPTTRVGRRVLVFDRLDSTSTLALRLAREPGAAERYDGLVVLAREQSAGRGQYGRAWTAPPSSSVLLSVLLFPPPHLRRPVLLTAWAAVAVGETVLALTGVQARIKWPNDVLVRGKKVCGILIEQAGGVVAGVGLNVRQTPADWDAAGLPDAAALGQFTHPPPETDAAARELIARLDREYELLLAGETRTLEACWKWRVGLLGRPVRVELAAGGEVVGRLMDMTFAALDVADSGGEVRRLAPEAVRHVHPA